MNKLFIGILVGLAVIIGLLINLTQVQGPKLSARADAAISETASNTPTYIRGASPYSSNSTATSTLLTMAGIHKSDIIEIGILAEATTTPAGSVKTRVQISQDASTWYPLPFETITNTGTQGTEIAVSATTTTFTINLPANGTSTIRLPKFRNIVAQYLRVEAWTSATATLRIIGFRLNQ